MTIVKRIIETSDASGLDTLLGEVVTLMCLNYFYTGKLVGVNETCVELENASIVYETGPFTEPNWKDAQPLPQKTWFVRVDAIESFGVMK